MKQSLQELATAMQGRLIQGSPALELTGVSIDTRSLKRGDVFFALKGPHFDAHDFLDRAVDGGAAALVLQRIPAGWIAPAALGVIEVKETLAALQSAARTWRQAMPATLIGIAGSNGKTTTKEMLASILSKAGKTLATAGNLNNHIGLPLTLLRLEADHRYGVIEMGTSMPGDMEILASLAAPKAALITNVGQDHLEFFGTPEGVLEENRKVFDALSADGLILLNLDDPLLAEAKTPSRARVVKYSTRKKTDVYAADVQTWPWPMSFNLFIDGKSHRVELPVIGTLQVLNAVAAAAAAYGLGIAPEHIISGLADFKPAAMRMQVQRHKSGAILVNDAYNANPSSVQEALESFCASFPKTPRWAVLGDMRELGSIARQAHRELGKGLGTLPLERVFLYGRDSRFIQEGALALKESGQALKVERFRKKRYLLQALEKELSREKPAILFKASRRMRLETVVQELMA